MIQLVWREFGKLLIPIRGIQGHGRLVGGTSVAYSPKTLGSFFWSLLEQGGTTLASLVVQIALTRVLAPEAFGVMAILLIVINIAGALAQSGLGYALIQKKDADSLAYSSAFWVNMALSVLVYVLIFFIAPFVSWFYGMADLTLYLRIAALMIIVNAFNTIQRAYLQDRMKFKMLSISNLVVVMVSGLSGILAALAGLGVWALIIQAIVQSVVSCGVMAAIVPWKPKREFSLPVARDLLGYGGKICATGILGAFYTGISELIIGKTCGASQLGYYSQGRKWPGRVISVISEALQNVLFPVLAHMKDDELAFRSALRRVLAVGNYVIIPASVLFALVADPLIVLLFTEKWLSIVPVFQCICLSNSVLMFQLVNLRAYMALGYSELNLKLQIAKVVPGTVILAAVALFARDINTVAFALMLITLFNAIVIDMQPSKRILGLSRSKQLKECAPCVAITCIAAPVTALAHLLPVPYSIQLVLQIMIFCSVYLILSFLFKLQGFYECRDILKSVIGGRR